MIVFFLKLQNNLNAINMKEYQPGSHIIATLESDHMPLLHTCDDFRKFIEELIHQYHLQDLGGVYHNFSPSGFTAAICLSESHISIHTWPEHKKINLDIYLSNYLRNNDGTVDNLWEAIVAFFGASVLSFQKIRR